MFHLHSLKEPPPKRMRETINFTSEVEASQESQPSPIQRQVDQSTASAETIVSAIKDVLLKLQFISLVNCRRQCCDGASNMMGQNWCGEKNAGPPTKGLSYSLSWTA